ncbi:FAD-dependent monooxygenase [Kitasatospora sp. CB01950]|uniref:FAD-dependent monooxygenase n=1 Tax=Kitasatospora sp. CB01950 TaxID=1703930 RepID=UPI00093E7429|nr:FAD-dependent monooxygenase [Kitasatospora sp. CB01950]OKI99167.1 monooxygenase [Kitasatospora sp. CB01950]
MLGGTHTAAHEVVIAGGGPVGLWLACELRLYGVDVTVLETRTEPDPHSRALAVHPRTLELFAARGLVEPFLAEGLRMPGGHFAALTRRMDFSRLDTPYPFMLLLPQVRTEQLIGAHAEAVGVRVLREHRVTGLAQHEDAVTVEADTPAGRRRLDAAYLIGCDGSRSTVRAAAGIGFPGRAATRWSWLADVTLDAPPAMQSASNEHGTVLLFPLPGGFHRVVGSDARTAQEKPEDLDVEELRTRVRRVMGTDLGMRDPRWISIVGNAARQAERYRHGRVLLAGDAAHSHFPAGGPGLNVGLADAGNLGWKLAQTLAGTAPDGLLDSYHAERHPVGQELLRSTSAQTGLMTSHTPENLALRGLLAELIGTVPEFSDALARRAAGIAVGYPPADASGAPDAHPLTGTRAPDLAVHGGGTLLSLLRRGRYVLLDLTTAPGAPSPLAPLVHDTTPGLDVRTGPPASGRPDWARVTAALVRPDGHLAWLSTDADPAGPARAAVTATLARR